MVTSTLQKPTSPSSNCSGSGPAQYYRSSAHRPHRRGNRRCKPKRAAAPARARRTEGRAWHPVFCGIVACRQGGRYRRGGRLSLPLDCRHATGDPEHLQRGDTCLATYSDGCSILLRRKDHNGQPVLPGFHRREDLVRSAPARMNENCVNSRVCLSVSARDGFLHALPGDQRLNPGHKDQFVVDRILHGAQAENLHRRAHILRQQTSLLEEYSVADQITAAYVPRRLLRP